MNDILKKIGEIGIIPVIKIEDASKAVPLAEALSRGGLPAAEVTFRTAAAAGRASAPHGGDARYARRRRNRAHDRTG